MGLKTSAISGSQRSAQLNCNHFLPKVNQNLSPSVQRVLGAGRTPAGCVPAVRCEKAPRLRAPGLQLHHLCIRPDGERQVVYHVGQRGGTLLIHFWSVIVNFSLCATEQLLESIRYWSAFFLAALGRAHGRGDCFNGTSTRLLGRTSALCCHVTGVGRCWKVRLCSCQFSQDLGCHLQICEQVSTPTCNL